MEWLVICAPTAIICLVVIWILIGKHIIKKSNESIKPNDIKWTDLHKFVQVPEHLRSDILVVKYPCKPCDKECNMSTCDKIETNDDVLLKRIILERCCPDCGGNTFQWGYPGGIAKNAVCDDCGHKFILCLPFYVERIYR